MLMLLFLRIFVLLFILLKLVLYFYFEVFVIEKRVYKVFSIVIIFDFNFYCLNWYISL